MLGFITLIPTIIRIIIEIVQLIRLLRAKGFKMDETVSAMNEARTKGDVGKLQQILEDLKAKNENLKQ